MVDTIGKLTGHRIQRDYLVRAAAEGNASHAYIFAGERGVGRYGAALEFAGNLFGIPANKLVHEYTPAAVLRHPDLLTVTPPPDKRQITIAQIRELTQFFTTHPLHTKYKIVIIRDADELSPDAQNALLKTLEEPPDFAVLILLAGQSGRLLPTVVSRCISLDFRSLRREELTRIVDTSDLSPLQAELLWLRLGGRPGSWMSFEASSPENTLPGRVQQLQNDSLGLLDLSIPDRFAWAHQQPLEDFSRATEILNDWIAGAQLMINLLTDSDEKLKTIDFPIAKALLMREDGLRDMMRLLKNLLALQAEWKPGFNTRLQLESQLIQWPSIGNLYE